MIAGAVHSLEALLRADAAGLGAWVTRRRAGLVGLCVAVIILGAGMYGAVMGSWRAPLQALFTGIKLPVVILLTTCGNGLLNGMLAPLLGLNLTFKQSLVAILVSFAFTSLILAALSPVALFLLWNTPPLSAATTLASVEYGVMQLSLAGFIAFAGIVGNAKLLPVLREWSRSDAAARKVLFAWLATNLLLGSQVCWVMRPFIWDPAGPVVFMGEQYFRGSFFETIIAAAWRLV
jgi:hypothetical protein